MMNQENKDILVPIGIPLRDWFAGQHIAGIWAREFSATYDEIAKDAFGLADAMLEAREHTHEH